MDGQRDTSSSFTNSVINLEELSIQTWAYTKFRASETSCLWP